MGHALSIGWIDDDLTGSDYLPECYSGLDCTTGADDSTNETVLINGATDSVWSVMTKGYEAEEGSGDRLSFSIEELLTIDTENVPTRDKG